MRNASQDVNDNDMYNKISVVQNLNAHCTILYCVSFAAYADTVQYKSIEGMIHIKFRIEVTFEE